MRLTPVLFFLLSSILLSAEEQPNILMICVDDMNNWIGAMDGPSKTPNIDALARRGMLFDNAYCVVPACNPSRTAIFTGQRPETTGQFGNAGNFRNRPGGADRVTLQQYLKQHGYETVGAGKIFHKQRGPDEQPDPISDPVSWDFQRVGNVGTKGHSELLNEDGWGKWHDGAINDKNGSAYLAKFGVWGTCPEPTQDTSDWKSSDFCADYLRQKHNKPFFLACGIFRPHSPQIAPQEFFDLYDKSDIVLPHVPENDMEDLPKKARSNFSTSFADLVVERGEWENAVHAYMASMSFADACIGNLLEALKNSEYSDNTIVVLWSDHGFQLAHKHRWEKYSLWKQATNPPFIVYQPGMAQAGQRCSEAVSFLDIYPTLLDLLGLPQREELEGTSLLPQLKDPSSEREIPAVITLHEAGNFSVVYKNWNYIRYNDGSEELYDHHTDEAEYRNLASNPRYAELKQRLGEWIPEWDN